MLVLLKWNISCQGIPVASIPYFSATVNVSESNNVSCSFIRDLYLVVCELTELQGPTLHIKFTSPPNFTGNLFQDHYGFQFIQIVMGDSLQVYKSEPLRGSINLLKRDAS